MKPVIPYMDENKQIIFVEIENKRIHDLVNGFIFGIILGMVIYLSIKLMQTIPLSGTGLL